MVLDVAEPTVPEVYQTSGIRGDSGARRGSDAQSAWAKRPIVERLALLRRVRNYVAQMSSGFCDAISPDLARTPADTRAAELLPLLAACRFLEREAATILAVRKLGRRGLPLWLSGVDTTVEHVALGQILVIAPANYPLFLPGVQVLQALAAGNSVVWKPGRGGRAVADLFASAMFACGLPRELLHVTDESVQAAQDALAGRVTGIPPAKVFFTGSASSGRTVMRCLAETLTPSVMELSGCDAVVVLPSADLDRVVRALAFGMRLNGSATCMAPRRLILAGASVERLTELISRLSAAFNLVPGVRLADSVRRQLEGLLDDAAIHGAEIHGRREDLQRPLLVTGVAPSMRLASADIFAPVLSVLTAGAASSAAGLVDACAYALTVSIFGDEREARALATKVTAGTVLINDLIVPTADPRIPFGGRRHSGFGATRGTEGLLEMTAPKVITVRTNKSTRHFEPTGPEHECLFDGMLVAAHSRTWRQKWQGLKKIVSSARSLQSKK